LKGVRIDKSLLPLLVYEGLYIYDIYPIMAFLCRRFKHEELLGRNIRQKVSIWLFSVNCSRFCRFSWWSSRTLCCKCLNWVTLLLKSNRMK